MDHEEERTRMRAMHRQVMTHDVDRWARSFLDFLDPATAAASEHHDEHEAHQ
jgi:trehalose 6-phosphate synthase